MNSSVCPHHHDSYEDEDDSELSLHLLSQFNGTLPTPTYSNTPFALPNPPSTHDERFHASLQLSSLLTYLRSRTALSFHSSHLHEELSTLDLADTQLDQLTVDENQLEAAQRDLQAALTAVEQREVAVVVIAVSADQAMRLHAEVLDSPGGLERMRDPAANRQFKEEKERLMVACDKVGNELQELEMEKAELGQMVGSGLVEMRRMQMRRNALLRDKSVQIRMAEENWIPMKEMEGRVLAEVLQLIILSKGV